MWRQFDAEQERPVPAAPVERDVRRSVLYKPKVKRETRRAGVRGVHTTDEGRENDWREGTLLWSWRCKKVSVRAWSKDPTTPWQKRENFSAAFSSRPSAQGAARCMRYPIGLGGVTSRRWRAIDMMPW